MTDADAEGLRARARELLAQAKALTAEDDERLILIMRAMELETAADSVERRNAGMQAEQQSAGPPSPALPVECQPAQQQQQVQPKDEE
jgi:hypothetical protein